MPDFPGVGSSLITVEGLLLVAALVIVATGYWVTRFCKPHISRKCAPVALEDDNQVFKRPVVTLPPEEAAAVAAHFAAANVILEYGSGGSTAIAAELPNKIIFSVESDAKWLAGMSSYFAANPPQGTLHLHHGKIGPTKAWGHPQDETSFREWPGYPIEIWDIPEFVHPDVVLIDGRFRAACFLTTLFRITKPTVVLWDDYIDRPDYHDVETLMKPVELIGRMARFELTPTPLPADRLGWIIEKYFQAN